jgi:hypothetical protein
MSPTGSVINKQYVIIPNLLYNLIAWVLTEDQTKGIVLHYFHQLTGKSRQHIWHLLHQGRARLECQNISTTLQSVLRTLTRSAEPVKLFNSTTRPTRFGVFHLTTIDIVYDVMCMVKVMKYDSFCFVNKKKIHCHQLPPTKDALQKRILRQNRNGQFY